MTTRIVSMLAKFAKNEDNSPEDIRAFVQNDAAIYSEEIGQPFVEAVTDPFAVEDEDVKAFVVMAIKALGNGKSEAASIARQRDAQASADALAPTCELDGCMVKLDALSFFASCLTTSKARLYVHAGSTVMAFPMEMLLHSANVVMDESRALTADARIVMSEDESVFHRAGSPIFMVRWRNSLGRLSGFNWKGVVCTEINGILHDASGDKSGDSIAHAEDVHFHVPVMIPAREELAQAAE